VDSQLTVSISCFRGIVHNG